MTRSNLDAVSVTLASNVADGQSFTAPYPTGRSATDFVGGTDHILLSGAHRTLFADKGEFSLAFGASEVTVTLNAGQIFGAGETVTLNFDRGAGAADFELANEARMLGLRTVRMTLGAPAASDGDGVCTSQAGTTDTAMTINGALAADGVATFDVPRNVVAAWTGTAVLTVTGTDEYGKPMVEVSGSGTSMTGKKAFKTVTSVVPSADITAATVGNSKVLGLPAYLASVADVLAELEDNAAATAGTIAPGDTDAPTGTTGDVRGTYSPNSNPNGARVFDLTAVVLAPGSTGLPQFAG